jgi:hypothetical protein
MNASGQVVGYLQNSNSQFSTMTPFFYTGGILYDLTTLSISLAGLMPTRINDRGQIIAATYLLTPGVNQPGPVQGAVPVSIASVPNGPAFTIAGANCSAGSYITPQTLYWTPGAACTVTFVSPHSSEVGTRYVFANWQDGSAANPRTYSAPAQAATYTALFNTQYLVVTVANPPQAGTVAGGGWYAAGSNATISATPSSGYRVVGWGTGSLTVAVPAAETITVNFAAVSTSPRSQAAAISARREQSIILDRPLDTAIRAFRFYGRLCPPTRQSETFLIWAWLPPVIPPALMTSAK